MHYALHIQSIFIWPPNQSLSGTFPFSSCCYVGQRLGTSHKMIGLPRSATLKHCFLMLGRIDIKLSKLVLMARVMSPFHHGDIGTIQRW